jgi:EmrB/QacA subfamily drug resistance transporter
MAQNAVSKKWLAMLGVGMGVFMATLDASIVNISLPTLVQVFKTDLAVIEWVVLSYTLVLTSLMLGIARLGDMYDKKKIYQAGLVLFTLGSFLCGTSVSVGWLIGFRALQGLGATMMQALGMAIVTEVFPANERGRALGITGSIVSIGIAIGPPLGGILIGLVGWQFIFWVNVPVGIITWFLILKFVPKSKPGRPGQKFDAAGAVILLVTLACYALGMTMGQQMGFTAPLVLAALTATVLGLGVFAFVEMRIGQPMVNLRMFRNALFSVNLLMSFLIFMVLSGGFLMPFILQNVLGYSTGLVGLFLISQPVATGLIAPLAGSLSDRFGPRMISVAGLVLIVVGCVAISTFNETVTPLGIILRLVPLGLGMGLFQSPNNSAIMGAVNRERLGVASGLLSLARTLGSSTGLPLMGSLFAAQALAFGHLPVGTDATTAPPAALVAGVTQTYHIAALGVLVTTLLAVLALWLDNRRKAQIAAGVEQELL